MDATLGLDQKGLASIRSLPYYSAIRAGPFEVLGVAEALSGLTIDPQSAVPVYRQIADGIRQGLEQGRFEAGLRLPATRDLLHQTQSERHSLRASGI